MGLLLRRCVRSRMSTDPGSPRSIIFPSVISTIKFVGLPMTAGPSTRNACIFLCRDVSFLLTLTFPSLGRRNGGT